MRSCSRYQKMMVESLYHALSPRRRKIFDAHLASCPDCAGEYQALATTLKVMDQRQLPAIKPHFWEGYWQRLSRKLAPEHTRNRFLDWLTWLPSLPLPVRPAWVSVAAALLLIATGIFIGRTTYLSLAGGDAAHARAAVFDPALVAEFNDLASRYLGRTRVLLLGLDNFDTSDDDLGVIDLGHQQMISRELLQQGRELRDHEVATADPRFQYLIDEIERVLLQLANSDGEDLVWTIILVQDGIDRNSILLKITLAEMGQDDESGTQAEPDARVKASSILI
ncbi:MAG: anti-sigma factor [Candidatus Neomarinimicrobiota bacterium]